MMPSSTEQTLSQQDQVVGFLELCSGSSLRQSLPNRPLQEDTCIERADRQVPAAEVRGLLRIEAVCVEDRSQGTAEGVHMRFRVLLSRQTLRTLVRLGLYTGSSDRIRPPGDDRWNQGYVELYCPRCTWTKRVSRYMKPRHYDTCPRHKISKRRSGGRR
jgi:hypothetical protein